MREYEKTEFLFDGRLYRKLILYIGYCFFYVASHFRAGVSSTVFKKLRPVYFLFFVLHVLNVK